MVTRVRARYVRVSPRKTRNVANLIKGMPVLRAQSLLDVLEKRPTIYIKRLLSSALDSADKKEHLLSADLYISAIKADQGPMLKRYRAASMGRATMVRHRTTHITLELDRIARPVKKVVEAKKVKKPKKTEPKKPVSSKRKKNNV